jgi:hypothetical protein
VVEADAGDGEVRQDVSDMRRGEAAAARMRVGWGLDCGWVEVVVFGMTIRVSNTDHFRMRVGGLRDRTGDS